MLQLRFSVEIKSNLTVRTTFPAAILALSCFDTGRSLTDWKRIIKQTHKTLKKLNQNTESHVSKWRRRVRVVSSITNLSCKLKSSEIVTVLTGCWHKAHSKGTWREIRYLIPLLLSRLYNTVRQNLITLSKHTFPTLTSLVTYCASQNLYRYCGQQHEVITSTSLRTKPM